MPYSRSKRDDLLVQPGDVMRLGDLGQRHDIRPAAHDGGKVVHAIQPSSGLTRTATTAPAARQAA